MNFLSRYTSCEWKIPDGRSCNIGPGRPECLADRDIHFNGNERNCSIRIDKIQIDQTGRWEVKLALDRLRAGLKPVRTGLRMFRTHLGPVEDQLRTCLGSV